MCRDIVGQEGEISKVQYIVFTYVQNFSCFWTSLDFWDNFQSRGHHQIQYIKIDFNVL